VASARFYLIVCLTVRAKSDENSAIAEMAAQCCTGFQWSTFL